MDSMPFTAMIVLYVVIWRSQIFVSRFVRIAVSQPSKLPEPYRTVEDYADVVIRRVHTGFCMASSYI